MIKHIKHRDTHIQKKKYKKKERNLRNIFTFLLVSFTNIDLFYFPVLFSALLTERGESLLQHLIITDT